MIKSNFEYRSTIKNVDKVVLHADLANITLVRNDSDCYIDFQGQKTIFGEPSIDISYKKDEAIINIRTIHHGFENILPGFRKRGKILLNIPPGLLEEIHLGTKNGNIAVDQMADVHRLSLISHVG